MNTVTLCQSVCWLIKLLSDYNNTDAIVTLALYSGKRNVMVWHPSICLFVPSAYSPWLTRGHHAMRPAYILAGK